MSQISRLTSFLLLLAPAAWAQTPALLPGRWEVYQLSFSVAETVPDSIRDHLDDPQVAALNLAIMDGEARLLVEFKPNGTYQFSVAYVGQPPRQEAGTYSLATNTLLARSQGPEGSSFNGQKISKLTKRTLILTFPVGPELPGVVEEVEYHRQKPH